MPKITLIASDMDGTLLNSSKHISPENIAAINELHKKNIIFAISSGRMYRELKQFIKLFTFPIPVIAINGGVVYDGQGNRTECNPFALEDLKSIVAILNDLNVYFELVEEEHFYSHSKKHREQLLASVIHVLPPTKGTNSDSFVHYCQYDDELIMNKTIYKLRVFNLGNTDLDMVKKEVLQQIPCEITSSASFNIEINPKGISKGKGIETLCRHYNLETKDVLAFGDNLNDLSMVETAGYFCAMGNSHPLILKKATHVTQSNDEHGVAKAISRIID